MENSNNKRFIVEVQDIDKIAKDRLDFGFDSIFFR